MFLDILTRLEHNFRQKKTTANESTCTYIEIANGRKVFGARMQQDGQRIFQVCLRHIFVRVEFDGQRVCSQCVCGDEVRLQLFQQLEFALETASKMCIKISEIDSN